ncbi:MAG: enoyl-CoA hydratase/isomerase family protein [Bdellovibrionales bacterium]|nr:enoyl-CoA hydratase/isomerase family protein [Bdellovibrionales bacterium]
MSLVNIKRSENNKIVHLELNLEEKRNILSLKMIQALTENIEKIKKEASIQCLILSGAGDHFCAGGDLKWMLVKDDISNTENINQIKNLSNLFNALNNFHLPIIGNVQGFSFGGALGLISLCDIALSDTKAQFCFSEIKLALIPALIAPFVLKKIPTSKAQELMLSGRVFTAQEALNMNLVHFVGDLKERQIYLDSLTSRLSHYDKKALQHTKRFLNILPHLKDLEIQDHCIQALAERRKTLEARSKIQKFLNLKKKKKEKFS